MRREAATSITFPQLSAFSSDHERSRPCCDCQNGQTGLRGGVRTGASRVCSEIAVTPRANGSAYHPTCAGKQLASVRNHSAIRRSQRAYCVPGFTRIPGMESNCPRFDRGQWEGRRTLRLGKLVHAARSASASVAEMENGHRDLLGCRASDHVFKPDPGAVNPKLEFRPEQHRL